MQLQIINNMSFASFIYRIPNSKKTYFGKYVFNGYISDDHNGLDIEIKDDVLKAINQYRIKWGESKIQDIMIGILAFSPGDGVIPVYSSEEEYKAFDLYYECDDNYRNPPNIYINGELM